jgi:dTDP-4-dehydrorhamnose reductase
VGPLSAYGRTKLAGERAVEAAGGVHAILRTAWVFAGHGGNFAATMLRVGRGRERLEVIDDRRGGPTPAGAIAAALVAMAQGLVEDASPEKTGIFHYAGRPAVTWCGFAREIFARTGWDRVPEVAPIRAEDWQEAAVRPDNSVLDCSRIARVWGLDQPDWRAALGPVLAELQADD